MVRTTTKLRMLHSHWLAPFDKWVVSQLECPVLSSYLSLTGTMVYCKALYRHLLHLSGSARISTLIKDAWC